MGNGLNQAMTAVLCLAWVIIYYSMMNGSEQAGAKLYFVAMCPYVILTIFLGMGLRNGYKDADLRLRLKVKERPIWGETRVKLIVKTDICIRLKSRWWPRRAKYFTRTQLGAVDNGWSLG